MPGSVVVGVIGQPMRVGPCRWYFSDPTRAPAVILTDDTGAFADWERPDGVDVVSISGTGFAPHRMRERLRSRVVRWMRAGSGLGVWVERWAKRFRPRPRSQASEAVGAEAELRQGLMSQLESIHGRSGISRIVVFDLLDLPSVVAFCEEFGVPVAVR